MATNALPKRPTLQHEMAFVAQGHRLVAGVDEVGRGALAGPIAAGAVILPLERTDLPDLLDGVRDSKLCSAVEREELSKRIREIALCAEVGMASQEEIDTIGIGAAARLAMRRAIESLATQPQALLIDWVRLREVNLPQRSMPKGDSLSLTIAAASIIAKVARDHLMIELDDQVHGYGFAQHKGYATPAHLAAIQALGPSALHRRSFDPIRTRLIDTE